MKNVGTKMLIPLAAGLIYTADANAQDISKMFNFEKNSKNSSFYSMSHGDLSIRDNLSMLKGLPIGLNSEVNVNGSGGSDLFKGQKSVVLSTNSAGNVSFQIGKKNNFGGIGINLVGDFVKLPDGQSNINGTVMIPVGFAHFWQKEDIFAMVGGSFTLKSIDTVYNAFNTHKVDALIRIKGVEVAGEVAIHPKGGMTEFTIYMDAKLVKFLNVFAKYNQGTNKNTGNDAIGVGVETQFNVYQKDILYANAFIEKASRDEKGKLLDPNGVFQKFKGGVGLGYDFNKAGVNVNGKFAFGMDESKKKDYTISFGIKKTLFTPHKMTI